MHHAAQHQQPGADPSRPRLDSSPCRRRTCRRRRPPPWRRAGKMIARQYPGSVSAATIVVGIINTGRQRVRREIDAEGGGPGRASMPAARFRTLCS